ncbi:EamA family transporter [Blastochloris tepida]|uniref:DMT transporter permease n=1 Tax=Blastochloris tepida TaxID=2233851 RepID=A0A348G5J5_9HYPH|nr:EamA family transporter [Blastochloris tepida]BBF94828.1 DMT transporter permease [Blastochloris tepida]
MAFELLWIPATLFAAATQTARNVLQRNLTDSLGTVGATLVRFLYGLPFSLLFLALVAAASGVLPPLPGQKTLAWAACGGLAQIGGTALMLAAMQRRSFAVTIAMLKAEPVLVALAGFYMLNDLPSVADAAGIATATCGVVLVSLAPSRGRGDTADLGAAGLGLAAGALFAVAAVGFRGAILAVPAANPLLAASTVLVVALAFQTAILVVWLALADRARLFATFAAWRPSLAAGFTGALASQFWYIGFALTSAANVRTLALVEVPFAHVVSGRLHEAVTPREIAGMALIVAGVAVLLLG